jgi:hypothetical protein
MNITCTRCQGSGFLNLHQVPDDILVLFDKTGNHQVILDWMKANDSDVSVCDCCGDAEGWYGTPGVHSSDDYGYHGPYEKNGGLPRCY